MMQSSSRQRLTRRLRRLTAGCFTLLAVLWLSSATVLAQTDSTTDADTNTEAAAEVETRTLDGDFLVLGEVGIGGGFPGYQLYTLNFSFQKATLGVAFRGSWTAAGPYISVAGRYYTPIPIPVPTYVSVGAGSYGANPTFFANFGAHIPLGLDSNFRVNIEAGGAYTPILDDWTFLPTVSIGLGYTFFIDAAPIPAEELERRALEAEARNAGCTEIRDPSSDGLSEAFDNALDRELNQARAAFAGVYSGLSYSITSSDTEIDGDLAVVTKSFSATYREVLTGKTREASGTVRAKFRWYGCGWSYSGRSFS